MLTLQLGRGPLDTAMDPFSQLSLDQLARVLSCVDIKPRLSSCSLVNSTWRTAAARATTSIQVWKNPPSFVQWLRAHTAKVHITNLEVRVSSSEELSLPLIQLQSLQSLSLINMAWVSAPEFQIGTAAQPRLPPGSSSSSRKQGLEHLTSLTKLTLRGSSVRLAGLAALTGLQGLDCDGAMFHSSRDSIPDFTAAEGELIAALPQLQHLTSLTLTQDIASAAVVANISALQSLQQLVLQGTTALTFAALPRSLTRLSLMFRHQGDITLSNAAGVSQLTALQSLELRKVSALDALLLANMRNLRSICLSEVQVAAGGLQVVSHFTALVNGG